MLNQPRVIALLYEKTFSMTGLEGNQQAEQDVRDYTENSKLLHEGYGQEMDMEGEDEVEGGEDFVDHLEE